MLAEALLQLQVQLTAALLVDQAVVVVGCSVASAAHGWIGHASESRSDSQPRLRTSAASDGVPDGNEFVRGGGLHTTGHHASQRASERALPAAGIAESLYVCCCS